jgi:phosphopantothenate synthetase
MDAYNTTYAYAYNSTYNYTNVDALLNFKKEVIDKARTTKGLEKMQIKPSLDRSCPIIDRLIREFENVQTYSILANAISNRWEMIMKLFDEQRMLAKAICKIAEKKGQTHIRDKYKCFIPPYNTPEY